MGEPALAAQPLDKQEQVGSTSSAREHLSDAGPASAARAFELVPDAVLRHLSGNLSSAELIAFYRTSKVTSKALSNSPELHNAQVSLRTEKAANSLLTLGYQIHQLPDADQRAAANAFISEAANLDRQHLPETQKSAIDEFLKVVTKAEDHELETKIRAHIMYNVAPAKVWSGESISVVATRYSLDREYLERFSAEGQVGARLRAGESVEAVAEQYGFETHAGIEKLVEQACAGPAIQAALFALRPLREIAEAHGMNALMHSYLREIAVKGPGATMAQNGRSVQEIVNGYGVATDPIYVGSLEVDAINGRAGDAVREGQPVDVVATTYGITTRRGISALQRIANNLHGGE